MKKIIFTGPESSGKTTLARQVATHFKCTWLPEYARTYLNHLNRPYEAIDLYYIAQGQLTLEQQYASVDLPFLICDTSFLVLKIWSLVKYKSCHSLIIQQVQASKNDLYVLCRPDIPWEADPLRENPDNREELYSLYQEALEALGADFIEVQGNSSARLASVIARLNKEENIA